MGGIPHKTADGVRFTVTVSIGVASRNDKLTTSEQIIKAADQATHDFGVGPGAVRFIDGTFIHHFNLEQRVAAFVGKPAP